MTDPRLTAIVDHLRKGISLPLTRHNAAALLAAVDAADTRLGPVPNDAIEAAVAALKWPITPVNRTRATAAIAAADAARGIVPFQWRRVEEYNAEPKRVVLCLSPGGTEPIRYFGAIPPKVIAWAELPAPPPWATEAVRKDCLHTETDTPSQPLIPPQPSPLAALERRMDALETRIVAADKRAEVLARVCRELVLETFGEERGGVEWELG